MGMKERMLEKISRREICVGVIGAGYVGLPLAVEKAKAGFKTICFDVSKERVDKINQGVNYIGDVLDHDLKEMVSKGEITASGDYSRIAETDFIAICVPTPLDIYQQPDICFVKESTEAASRYLKKDTMVVLESTTYPGTTRELILPILEKNSGLKCGEDFYLGFSPERVDPGNAFYKTSNTPKVVGGMTPEATEVIAAMYRAVLQSDIFEASSPEVAEMEKILENTYRNINIGLINEMAQLCHRMKIDIWEVVEAAKTKPYGFQAFYPGPGLGGHCIPLDPYYLSWKAREFGFHTSMIESSMMINDKMPEYCVERAAHILNTHSKSIKGAKILQLGISYKADIDDFRESPAIRVFEILKKMGAEVVYYDPCVKDFFYRGNSYASEPALTADLIAKSDLVFITTDHSNVDYALVKEKAATVFDTKDVMRRHGITGENIEIL